MSLQVATISRDDDSSPTAGQVSPRRRSKISGAAQEMQRITPQCPRDGYTIPANCPATQRNRPLIRRRRPEWRRDTSAVVTVDRRDAPDHELVEPERRSKLPVHGARLAERAQVP